MQTRIDIRIHDFDHLRDRVAALADAFHDGIFAAVTMGDESLDMRLGIGDRRPMGRPIDPFVPREHLAERIHVIRHIAVRRGNHRGRPAHDMIATEDGVLFAEREADMVRRMARCMDRFERPSISFDHVPILDLLIRHEFVIAAFFDLRPAAVAAMGAVAIGRRSGRLLKGGRCRRMIAMGMCDQDMRDGLAFDRTLKGRNMIVIQRPRIDHCNLALPDDIGTGSVKRETAGVVTDHAPDQRAYLVDNAVFELDVPNEGDGHIASLTNCICC